MIGSKNARHLALRVLPNRFEGFSRLSLALEIQQRNTGFVWAPVYAGNEQMGGNFVSAIGLGASEYRDDDGFLQHLGRGWLIATQGNR